MALAIPQPGMRCSRKPQQLGFRHSHARLSPVSKLCSPSPLCQSGHLMAPFPSRAQTSSIPKPSALVAPLPGCCPQALPCSLGCLTLFPVPPRAEIMCPWPVPSTKLRVPCRQEEAFLFCLPTLSCPCWNSQHLHCRRTVGRRSVLPGAQTGPGGCPGTAHL